MTHAQWHKAIRRALAVAERQPARALKALDALLVRLQSDARTSVGDWHIEQTLETISAVQAHIGKHRESAETMLRIARHHEQQLLYYRRAFVAACATAALELAAAGDRRGARRLLARAKPAAAGLRPPEKLFRKATSFLSSQP
ncbi:MAG: hypothetical protein ACRD3G_11280 [Vicinamibacterales bacterium]